MTAVPKAVRESVAERSALTCELCYRPLYGQQVSLHHRRPRRMGGTRRIDTNRPSNLLLLCGSGTTGCHGWVESYRTEAHEWGVLLHDREAPAESPYRDKHGDWWLLDDDGGKRLTAVTHPNQSSPVS
jgi:hypothetical protein